jgi:hypothetical protein
MVAVLGSARRPVQHGAATVGDVIGEPLYVVETMYSSAQVPQAIHPGESDVPSGATVAVEIGTKEVGDAAGLR